jgi:outer membrane immunogenic protein
MKKFLLGSVALAAMLAGPAMAADMPVKVKPVPVEIWDWSGVYMGGQLGYGWGRASAWLSDFNCAVGNLCDTPGSQNLSGYVAGGQWGARWQWGAFVLGIESSYAWTGMHKTAPATCTPGVNTCIGIPGGFDVSYETRINELATATLSLGWAWDRSLIYVKGGWAGGDVVRKMTDVLGPAPAAMFYGGLTQKASGWTAGIGWEYIVLKTSLGYVSFGIEYDYVRLNAGAFVNNAYSFTPAAAFTTFNGDIKLDVHQVVARANVAVDWCRLGMWDCAPPVVKAKN